MNHECSIDWNLQILKIGMYLLKINHNKQINWLLALCHHIARYSTSTMLDECVCVCVCAGWYLQHVLVRGGLRHRRQGRLHPAVGRRLQADHQDRPPRGRAGIQRYKQRDQRRDAVATSARRTRDVFSRRDGRTWALVTLFVFGDQLLSTGDLALVCSSTLAGHLNLFLKMWTNPLALNVTSSPLLKAEEEVSLRYDFSQSPSGETRRRTLESVNFSFPPRRHFSKKFTCRVPSSAANGDDLI